MIIIKRLFLSVLLIITLAVAGFSNQHNFFISQNTAPVAVSGEFSPSDISGLQAWWDCSTDTYLTRSGALISQIDDRSGNGNHFVQTSDSAKPSYTTSQLNGLSGAVFSAGDGTSDTMYLSTPMSVSQPYTFFVLIKVDSTSSDDYVFTGSNAAQILWYSQFSAQIFLVYNTTGGCGSNSYDTSPLLSQFIINGTSSECHSRLVDTTGINAGTNDLTLDWIGSQFSSKFTGTFFEVLIYNSVLSAGDVTSIETYFTNKWGSGI